MMAKLKLTARPGALVIEVVTEDRLGVLHTATIPAVNLPLFLREVNHLAHAACHGTTAPAPLAAAKGRMH